MPFVINNTKQIVEKIHTTNGEMTVNLNLTITLQQDGQIQIETQKSEKKETIPVVDNSSKTVFEIPDFDTNDELINFGK
jgi:hypothetical protein